MRAAFALCALVAVAAAPREASAENITLDQAVAASLEHNRQIAMSGAAVDAARSRVEATRAMQYPSLDAEANVLVWNEEIVLDLAPPGVMLPPDLDSSVTVRDRVTAAASVTLAQPLTRLLTIRKLVDVEQAGLGAAQAEVRAARLDVALQVAQAYFQALQADAARSIAAASVNQVDAQLRQARALEEVGMLGRVDVMRLEAALAASRQQELQARTGAALARDTLALAMGRHDPSAPEPVDDFPDKLPAPPWQDAGAPAVDEQPAFVAARRRSEQARLGQDAARANRYPNVAAVARYEHTEGNSTFQAADSWFVGLNLEWNLWDWGKQRHEIEEAGAQARRAALGVELLEDQLLLQARSHVLQARTAYEALSVARSGLEAAEEAFRMQSARYAEGSATTTDLLQAETEVTQARLRYSTARFAYLGALAAAAHALGQMPTDVLP